MTFVMRWSRLEDAQIAACPGKRGTIAPMPKALYYAVVKGRTPGIYTRWSGDNGAEAQVKGFPGAIFKGFASREEAEAWMRGGGKLRPRAQAPVKPAGAAPMGSGEPLPQAELPKDGSVVIYTDGASTGNPGPGGYGAVILSADGRKELSGGFRCTTNNRMELTGVIEALRALPGPSKVTLYSDSSYVVNAVSKGWALRWRASGWMRNATERAENADLWASLLDLLKIHQVTFQWVKGHASNPENERCDRLAVKAAHAPNLPPDAGFSGRCS